MSFAEYLKERYNPLKQIDHCWRLIKEAPGEILTKETMKIAEIEGLQVAGKSHLTLVSYYKRN